MTPQELEKRKLELQKEVLVSLGCLFSQFKEETGFYPTYVGVDISSSKTMDGANHHFISDVDLQVTL
jgi:hypothetical protein